jgi:hypothetical protein
MAQMIRCKVCGDENPADARYCIDCGSALGGAATGPTARLAGVLCSSCRASNSENARFCVVCGQSMVAPARQPQPARPTPRPTPARPTAQQSFPRVASPPTYVPYRPQMSAPIRRHRASPGGMIFVIGLVVLLMNHAIWPGILLLIGLSSLANEAARGRPQKGALTLLWFGGFAFLFATGAYWPGILVLMLLHWMISSSRGWHW